MSKPILPDSTPEQVAGNGLLHRRIFLTHGAALIGAGSLGLLAARPAASQDIPSWMRPPATGRSAYEERSTFEPTVTLHVVTALGPTGPDDAPTH